MNQSKQILVVATILIVFCHLFTACSSSKMTQAEIAEYYKDLKITGKGTGSYTAKTKRISRQIQTATPELQQLSTVPPITTHKVPTTHEQDSNTLLTHSDNPIVVENPSNFSAVATEKSSLQFFSPDLIAAKEKMERAAKDKNLTKKEKKAIKKEVRKTVMKELKERKKAVKTAKRNGQETNDGEGILRIIFAFILPPLSVFLGRGIGGAFWLNVVLTLLGFLPGIIHALIILGEDVN